MNVNQLFNSISRQSIPLFIEYILKWAPIMFTQGSWRMLFKDLNGLLAPECSSRSTSPCTVKCTVNTRRVVEVSSTNIFSCFTIVCYVLNWLNCKYNFCLISFYVSCTKRTPQEFVILGWWVRRVRCHWGVRRVRTYHLCIWQIGWNFCPQTN